MRGLTVGLGEQHAANKTGVAMGVNPRPVGSPPGERTDLPPIQDYRRLAEDYDRQRYVGDDNALKEAFRRLAVRTLLPAAGGRALDLACGTGRGLLLLDGGADLIVGVDGTLAMLGRAATQLADRRGTICLCNANSAALPFADATFDLVTRLNFFHLFPDLKDKRAFLDEIGRVLRTNGTAIVEFDNALHGLVLGPLRKYFGRTSATIGPG